MALVTLPYTLTAGQPENVNQLNSNLAALVAGVNDIDTAQINDAQVTDAKLASPNNTVYRTIAEGLLGMTAFSATGTYVLGDKGKINTLTYSPSDVNPASAVVAVRAADFAVAGKTTKLRLKLGWFVGSTAINGGGSVHKLGLYPVTLGGTTMPTFTALGTVVTGSEVTLTGAGVTQGKVDVGSDFDLPADGVYTIGLAVSVAANPSGFVGRWYLEMRHV